MSVCIKFSVGAAGGAGARVLYDTKERATKGEPSRVWTKNVPEYVDRKGQEIIGRAGPGSDPEVKGREGKVRYKERRTNLAEFARQMDEDEKERSHDGKGDTRSFYRAIYGFHKDLQDEKAIEMVDKHQAEKFPKCIIINSLHRNADHVHVHSIIFARQIDDRKLQLGWKTYRSIDESWARIYGQEFGKELEHEHLKKKEERRAHRKDAQEAKQRGEPPPPRPVRVSHARNQIEERKKIALREHGITHHEQPAVRGNQRPASSRDRKSERAVAQRAVPGDRTRERQAPGGERGSERATGEDGISARESGRDAASLSGATEDRVTGTGGSPPEYGRVTGNRTKPSRRGVGQGRSATGGTGGRAQAGGQTDSARTQTDQHAGRGAGGRSQPGEHYDRGMEASGHTGNRADAKGAGGTGPDGADAFAGELQKSELGGQQQVVLTPVRGTAGKSPEATMASAPGSAERQSGLGDRSFSGSGAIVPGNLSSELDRAMAEAMKPLSDQQEKEHGEQEQLEIALQHELAPAGGTVEPTDRETPEQSREMDRSMDLSFDR
jgi:hypothetical protein